jgi:Zn-dependent protease
LAPILALAALCTLVGTQVGLPLLLSAIIGGTGGSVSLLFHELGHVRAAAKVPGVRPVGVCLIWAGAATTLEGRYSSGRDQIRVAVGGPQASFTFAMALLAVCLLPVPAAVLKPMILLAVLNIALGVLNLLPAYPLDGYKLVVGALWSLTGSERTARKVLRRMGIGWAALEVPGALVLLVEKPLLGSLVVIAGASLYLQKRMLHRLVA